MGVELPGGLGTPQRWTYARIKSELGTPQRWTYARIKSEHAAFAGARTDAVIHRDYNISDDILVWVFDNRIEVRSPGVLPGHMTLDNLLTERFARNPLIVRLLNKYPDPPNKLP